LQRKLVRRIVLAAVLGGAPAATAALASGGSPAKASVCVQYSVTVNTQAPPTGPCQPTPPALGQDDLCVTADEGHTQETITHTDEYDYAHACVPQPGT
jgi:hypothetical protein